MSATATQAPTDSPNIAISPGARNAVLFAVMCGLFLSSLDQTVVGTALPRIMSDLNGNSLYTWVVTAYLLSSTITVPIYGKFSDVFGRKIMLLIGVGLFLVGSFLSGLSQTALQLVIFRGVQGLGAGALFPIALSIIGDLFTPRERGRYQGLFGGVFAVSFVIGPFIGGWITDNISWHWVFYVNLPVGFAAFAIIATVLPNFHPRVPTDWRDLDYVGIGLFTAAVVPILLGLTNKVPQTGTPLAWTDPRVGGLMLLGAACLLAFLFAETKAEHPIIPLGLFTNRTFAASNAAVFLVMFGMFAAFIFLPRYYQAALGYSATSAGYQIWPLLVGLLGSSIIAGQLISRTGTYKRILLSGVTLFCVGAFMGTFLSPGTSNYYLWASMFLMGLGIGPAMSGFTVVVQNAVGMQQIGVATGTMTFLRQIGGAVGLAISGTMFSEKFTNTIPEQLSKNKVPEPAILQLFNANLGQSLTKVGLGRALRHKLPGLSTSTINGLVRSIHDSFTLSTGYVFWLTFGSAIVAFVATMVVKEIPLRGKPTLATEAASMVTGAEMYKDDRAPDLVPASAP
jgi:EmrB/QacA subfamily drug resistance transporter